MEASTSATSTDIEQRLSAVLSAYESVPSDDRSDTLSDIHSGFKRLLELINEPVRIAFFGETNVGKTTLANRMLGAQVLPTSVVANTPYLVHVSYGLIPAVIVHTSDGKTVKHAGGQLPHVGSSSIEKLEIVLPLPQLKDIQIFDTPSHDKEAAGFENDIPKADICVWCTNASRAWSASDRAARLKLPPIPRARAILVATNADTLANEVARASVRNRLEGEASALFGTVCFAGMTSESSAETPRPEVSRTEQDVSFE
ncbi:MAG: dynamin family protein, partial [Pseudomonadota bacterium]